MLCAPIKTRAVLSLYSFFVCFFACNACYSCGPTHWLQDVIGVDLCTHIPESGELLKAVGLVFGVAAIMRGLKQVENIINDIDQEERRYQQSIVLPDTLKDRVYRRRSIQDSTQEMNQGRAQHVQGHAKSPSLTTQKMQARAEEAARLQGVITSLNQKLAQEISKKTEFEQNACDSNQKKMKSYNKKIAQFEVTIRLLKEQLPDKKPRKKKEAMHNQEIERLYTRQCARQAINSFLMLDTPEGKRDFGVLNSGCVLLNVLHNKDT